MLSMYGLTRMKFGMKHDEELTGHNAVLVGKALKH